MSVVFRIAIKGTNAYCFLENAFCCVSATEFGLCFLPKLVESATYCCNAPLFLCSAFPSPLYFFPGKPKSDCYVVAETCCFFSSLSTAGSTVSI